MSITFYPAYEHDDGSIRMLDRCDCDSRYYTACMEADLQGLDTPDPIHCEVCALALNVSNANALDLLEWLDLPAVTHGHIKATELAAKCRRRLWDEPRNYDRGIDGYSEQLPGHARLISFGRDAGYLRDRTELLLKICEAAGDKLVGWA